MDGHSKGPNQGNPETGGDDAAFDAYMRSLFLVDDADAWREELLPEVPDLPPDPTPQDRLDRLAAGIDPETGHLLTCSRRNQP